MPAIGEHRINPTTGKTEVWGGDNYQWQSPESYRLIDNIPGNADPAKEQVNAAVENRSVREKFLGLLNIPNTLESWGNQKEGIEKRTGYEGPSFDGPFGGINPSAMFGGPIIPSSTKWRNQETGEVETKPGFSMGPVADQIVYGGTAGVAKSLANLQITGAARALNPSGGPVDPASTPVGALVENLDRAVREAAPGLELPEDRPKDAEFAEILGAEGLSMLVGTGLAMKAVGATAFTQGVFSRLSPQMQTLLRWASGIGIESATSTVALGDQNIDGNAFNAIGGPLAVTPMDDNLTATGKNLVPNFVLEFLLGGAAGVAGKGAQKGLNATVPNIADYVRKQRAVSDFDRARIQTEEWGQQVQTEDGVWEFTNQPEPQPAPEPAPTIELDLQEGTVTAKPPEAPTEPEAPQQPPATMQEVDEMLLGKPEVDTAVIATDRLGDEQLQAIDPDQPILDQLEGQLQQQQDIGPAEGLTEIDVLAPRENVANGQVSFAEQWEQLPTEQLLGYASPGTNPRLFREIEQMTGRDYSQFTRRDVIDGLVSLEEQGLVALPNRMQPGVELMPVVDIEVDPQRFQFKEGVNEKGQQIGNSLEGVQRWNPDAEGEITVWQDKADGRTYVINGHNRLAKARQLGIPTVRVRRLLAGDAGQARALGAIENISQGGGTAFDAAKFIRESGITNAAELEAAGIPLESGTGKQGLALSRLPDGLFQEAIDGVLPVNRAIALGNSNLNPEAMFRVARMGERSNMSERGFAELVQLAETSPEISTTAATGQTELPGMETLMDTMAIKSELAAKVRAQVVGKKNLFGKVAKRQAAEQLAGAGTTVNVDAAQVQADLLRGLSRQFDSDKYMTGTAIGQALNDGTNDIANGAAEKAVVQGIVDQITQAAEATPPGAVRAPEPEGLTAGQIRQLESKSPQELATLRETLQKDVLSDRVRANRQARMAEFDAQNARQLEWMNDDTALRQGRMSLEDYEAKYGKGAADGEDPPVFMVENKKWKPVANALKKDAYARNVIEWIDSQPERGLTAGERNELRKGIVQRAIDNGEVRPSETPTPELPDGPRDLTDPVQTIQDEVRLAGEFQRQADVNEFAARRAREKETGFDELPLEEKKQQGMLDGWDTPPLVTRQGFDPLEEVISNPNERFTLDKKVLGSPKPRYSNYQLEFQDNLDLVAYMIRNNKKASKAEPKYIKALTEQGFDISEVRAHGDAVLQRVKDVLKERNKADVSERAKAWLEIPRSEIDLETVKPTAEGNARAAFGDSLKKAGKPITAKTSQLRIEMAAQLLKEWANAGTPDPRIRNLDDALALVRRKNAILVLDNFEGLDFKKAMDEKHMGKYGDDFYKAQQAHLEFYGVDGGGGGGVKPSSGPGGGGGGRLYSTDEDLSGREFWSWLDRGNYDKGMYKRDRAELMEDITMAINRVAGRPLGGIQILDGKKPMMLGSEWGTPRKANVGGWYQPTEDLIVLADFQGKTGARLLSTAYHEAFHRVQYNVLSQKDMNVLNSAWGRMKLYRLDDARPKKLLETQAVAFQNYAELRGMRPGVDRDINKALLQKALADSGVNPRSFSGKALTVLAETWEKIIDTIERLNNLARGNGFRTVYDLFDDVYSGKLKDRRKWVQLENSMADLQLERQARLGDEIDVEAGNFLDAVERSETLDDWRNNAAFALKRHQEFYAKEIEALKTQAMAGGC